MTKKSNEVVIPPDATVIVTKMNHIIEVQHMEKMNHTANIKKLDKDTYLDIRTGEIKEFNHIENRQQSFNSLRQTFKKIRYLINNNFVGNSNELHLTLTYKENMMDTKRLLVDFSNFYKRLKYRYKDSSTLDYITVVEPQKRGAWHCHCLIRFNDLNNIFIENKELSELWGQGFVTIKSLKNVDNIGAYLSAYLTDIELSEENYVAALSVHDKNLEVKEIQGKKYIKGGRLHMYPPGMNLYRKTKGMIHPTRERTKFKNIKKIVGSAQPHYSKSYIIENDNFENTINFLQYNTKRK